MKKWFKKNYKTVIISSFIIPIITVAVVSISHVTTWYGLTNPISWAIYLSFGIEVAALSALAAISSEVSSKIYIPFSAVTLIQFIGNVFYSYTFIDVDSQTFKDWVDLVSPFTNILGIESNDSIGNRRFLSLFSGGLLPLISLSFLHMLVKFSNEQKSLRLNEEEEPLKEDLVVETPTLKEDENMFKTLLNNMAEIYEKDVLTTIEDVNKQKPNDIPPTTDKVIEQTIDPAKNTNNKSTKNIRVQRL